MKTSFYIIFWFLIMAIIGQFDNSFIVKYNFVVTLVVFVGLSWLLNLLMPGIQTYEKALKNTPILEDVYTGNVASFQKRLARETNAEIAKAIICTLFMTAAVLDILSGARVVGWIMLIIFGILSYGSISRSISLLRARASLKSNPTPEQCTKIADETYGLDYASYHDAHNGVSYQDMLPPKPKYFKAYNVFSAIIAAILSLFGLLILISGVFALLSQATADDGDIYGILLLLVSLATYVGVKDFMSCIRTKSKTITINSDQSA